MPFTFKISVRLARMKPSLTLAAVAALAACGLQDRRVTGPNPPNDAVVQVFTTPDSVTLDPYQTRPFVAYGRTQAGDSVAVAVTWSASGGAISSSGLYTADTMAGAFQVTATMTGASLSASSRVRNRGQLAQVIVMPASATVTSGGSLAFAAYGKRKSGDSVAVGVTWSATGGGISSAGLYTAGASAGTYRVIATQSGGTLADTAAVTITSSPPVPPGTVTDLAVAGVTDTSVTLSFTEVTDGTGQPAKYDIRWAVGMLTWASATDVVRGTCAVPMAGTTIGAKRSCTVLGLAAGTGYQFQLVAFRGTLNVDAVFGALSNVASGTTRSSSGGTILFSETFEDGAFASRGWYDNTSMVTTTTQHLPTGTSAAEMHFTVGATIPVQGTSARHLFAATPTLYVSYWVKYSSNWVGSGHPYHPHEFLILSDQDGDWDGPSNGWLVAYIEQSYQNGGIPRLALQDNKAINTSYGAPPINLVGVTESRSVAGCNGVVETNVVTTCFNMPPWYNDKELLAPQVWFQPTPGPGYKGDWNHVEVYLQINSVVGGIGVADGVMQYWFNGTLVIDRHDILFRTGARPTIQFHQFMIAPYIGDGSPVDQYMWIDDLTVATGRP